MKKIKILIILPILLFAVFYFGKSANAAKIKIGKLWSSNNCSQNDYAVKYSWFFSTGACAPPTGVEGRYVINYEIFVSAALWDRNTDIYIGTLLDLKNWVTANYASYGYANADEAFEDCFVHLKTGETPVTATPAMGGSITVQPYDPNNPKLSRIPGPWGNPSGPNEWYMNLHATIYNDFWRLSKLINYTSADGLYFDTLGVPGWPRVSSGGAITYARTKEYANDTDDTYKGLLYSFLDATKTVINNQGKILGGNIAGSVNNNYPYKDYIDFIIREFNPSINTPTERWEAEITVSKNALASNPSLKQIYDHQYTTYDDRAKMTILASYYTIQNANTVMLVRNDYKTGNAFWADAWTYDIGTASGNTYRFASGTDGWTGCDPSISQPWIVLGRQYSNALVLWRGVPWRWQQTACWDIDAKTAKIITLGGTYKPLNADGTLGPAITTIDLKNWEGAVLIKSSGTPDTTPPAAPTGVVVQ